MMVEKRLKEGFATLPNVTDIDGNQHTVKFEVGSEEDCQAFLNDNRATGVYPLIWLQTPFNSTGKLPRLNVRFKLILATLASPSMTNSERIEISFEPILNPLLANVIKFFNRSGFTTMRNRDNEKRANHFKYSVDDQNPTSDIWDAITFECDIEMNDCPMRAIPY